MYKKSGKSIALALGVLASCVFFGMSAIFIAENRVDWIGTLPLGIIFFILTLFMIKDYK